MKKNLAITLIMFLFCGCFAQAESLREQFLANKSVIYVINIRSFNSCDANKNGIIDLEKGEEPGTFMNAVTRLEELKAKGINAVHVLPVTAVGKKFAYGNAGSLYAMASFINFDRLFDDRSNDLSVEEEAKIFIEECHKRGINVIFDMPACGAYDLTEKNPELFEKDKDGNFITPLDWSDVRLFKVVDEAGQVYAPTYEAYRSYVDLLLSIGVDGIRADVAGCKSYDFWVKLISYARSKKPDFMFLAESSESWKDPIAKEAPFTPYDKLLDAGFDGYLGSFFNLKLFNKFDLPEYMAMTLNTLGQYKTPKTLIGGFATHDEKSPLLNGGENFARQILWLNATLPLNPYFLDGFDINDRYMYPYVNQKACESYTDCERYFVHNGQIDIFNLAAKPNGNAKDFPKEFVQALNFRAQHIDLISKGKFLPVKLKNQLAFAYALKNKKGSILVVASKDFRFAQAVDVDVRKFCKLKEIHTVWPESEKCPEIKKGIISLKLLPLEIKVFTFE